MNQKLGTIYIAINLLNGKQYIGQTVKKLRDRVYNHKNSVHNLPFPNAIKKYGKQNFKWVSFSCPEEDLDWQERFLIKELNTLVPNGYNLEDGGHTLKHHHKISIQKMKEHIFTEEHKKHLKENRWDNSGKNNPNFGKKFPKLSEKMKGKNNPMFGKTGSSAPCFGRSGNKHPMYGKKNPKVSERNKKLIGDKHPNTKPSILVSPDGIKYQCSCVKTFCEKYHLNPKGIYPVLNGKRIHHKGWTGKYINNSKEK